MNKLRTLIVMAALVVSGVAMAQDKPYLTAEDVQIGSDGLGVLSISMSADEAMNACNFQFYLPEGVEIDSKKVGPLTIYTSAGTTDLVYEGLYTQSFDPREGYMLVNFYSPSKEYGFMAASGVLAKITLKASDALANGTYEGSLKGVGIANKDAVSVNQGKIPDVTFKITKGQTGVKSAVNGADSDALYDLQGRKVMNPQKGGVYVKKGKKVVR